MCEYMLEKWINVNVSFPLWLIFYNIKMPLLILAKTLLMYSKPNLHSLSIPKTVNYFVYTTLVTTALCALISY